MRFLIQIFALLVAALSGQTAMAAMLHIAHGLADPPFEKDEAGCQTAMGQSLVGYVGQERVCADAITGNVRNHPDLLTGAVDEIVLLTSRPGERTFYDVGEDRGAMLPLANIIRRAGSPLVIRGLRDGKGEHLVWFRGLDLIAALCQPGRVLDVEACRKGLPAPEGETTGDAFDRFYEMTSLAAIESARVARAIVTQPTGLDAVTRTNARSYCVVLSQVSNVELRDLAFRDCWLTAVKAVNASRVTLAGAHILGSTFGFLAVATEGMEPGSHTFEVLDTHWTQSPGAYRPEAGQPCAEPHRDLGCALDIWDDIPWGVTHHHIWRPLNGALFASVNIAGNVLVAGNTIERAYNGIRMISEVPGTGRNVEIRDNVFRFLRDNAVEPENRADGWVIKHNVFENVHAWITSDGVDGGGMYVFGNRGWTDPDHMPGERCSDATPWASSPRFLGLAGDAGRYELIDVSYDPTSVDCRGHYRGVILKTGDKRKAGFPYFRSISIFHNSWRTRSPLFSSKHASPLSHFNNAIAFAGCGLEGPWHCKQIPAPLEYCGAGNKRTRGRGAMAQFWTSDGNALVADCFSFVPGPAVPDERATETREVAHTLCRDLYDRGIEGIPYGDGACSPVVESPLFLAATGLPGKTVRPVEGCDVAVDGVAARPDCSRDGAWVGAVRADGSLFDMDIPGAGFLGDGFRP